MAHDTRRNRAAGLAAADARGARGPRRAERRFRDHHRYRRSGIAGLTGEARLWVTTERDALKIHPAWAAGADLRALAIELEVSEERELLDWIEKRIR